MVNIDEVSKDVLDYIVSDINLSLTRLGISEPLVDITTDSEKKKGYLKYATKSAIKQMPMIFKELVVSGSIYCEEDGEDFYLVSVNLYYSWSSFGGGYNGTELGNIVYRVDKRIPKIESKRELQHYIRKKRGLEI